MAGSTLRLNPQAPVFVCSDRHEKQEACNQVLCTGSGVPVNKSVRHKQEL